MRLRLTALEGVDLNLFRFDYDLTMMVFFLDADERIISRYGGRDGDSADARQSLAGLRYTMASVLDAFTKKTDAPAESDVPARKTDDKPLFVRDLVTARRGSCVHCHQVHEAQHRDLKRRGEWTRDNFWRYPPPDNLGMELEVDRGNVVERVTPDSPAAALGLRAGDVVRRIGNVNIRSFGDAQFALDGAPKAGAIDIAWRRGEEMLRGTLNLEEGWRKTDVSWRSSLQWAVPSARVYGRDLNAEERKARGLTDTQLAFWQGYPLSKPAKEAGVQLDDVILGFDGRKLNMTAYEFLGHVRQNYVVGDRVTIDILRGDKRLSLPMQLP